MTKTLHRYTRIDKVIIKTGVSDNDVDSTCLLTNDTPELIKEFEVDLLSECMFNELPIIARKKLYDVKTTDDIIAFAKVRNLKLEITPDSNKEIIVGDLKNGIIDHNLHFQWIDS